MAKPKVLLRFDTEDYITPESNQALHDLLDLLQELHIQATFCMVGRKVEYLVDAKETATLDKLQHHALGYHSYLHSFHPLASEYLQGVGWWDGFQELLKVEDPGHEAFVEIFDQPPVCYTQPGADWVPHTYMALQQWEVGFFFTDGKYSLIDYQQQPFLINGILTLAKIPTIANLTSLATSPGALDTAKCQFGQDYRQARQNTNGLEFLLLVDHPGRLITQGKPWDVLNFSGENIPRDQWQTPAVKSPEDYQRDLRALRDFLLYLMQNYDFDWITAQDCVDIYQNRIIHKDRVVDLVAQSTTTSDPKQAVDLATIQEIAKAFTQEISFYRLDDQWLSPIQAASILCQALVIRAREGYFPKSVPIPHEIFFPEQIHPVTLSRDLDRLGWAELVQGAEEIITQIKQDATFPLRIKVGSDLWVELEAFMSGVAQAIVSMTVDHIAQDRVLLPKSRLQTRDYVKKSDQVEWSWPIFKSGFRNDELLQYTEYLTWTMKPILMP